MTSYQGTVGALLVAFALIATPGCMNVSGDPAGAASRYQVSAYAGGVGEDVHHGCYIVDTRTGELWHARLGGTPEKVADKLE